jgi:hypothetical protein
MGFIWRGGAAGAAWEVGVWAVVGESCWAIASVPPWIIASARADNIINLIFMYIPQMVK